MEAQTKKVSVIIPVYNAEKYIRKTLDSVLAQSFRNREILLVENGCEDQSTEILREYKEKYDEIRLISCADRGAGAARNTGLEQAAGEYILFVDADDYLPDTGILEKYVKAAEQTGVDVVISNYARLWEERVLPAVKHSTFSVYSPSSEEFRFQGFFGTGTLSYVWGRLYRRSFLAQNQITFADLTYAEDKLFNMECYICKARYLFLEDVGYIYRRNKDSISWQYHEDATENWLKMAHLLSERLEEKQSLEYENMIWYTVFFAVFFDPDRFFLQAALTMHPLIPSRLPGFHMFSADFSAPYNPGSGSPQSSRTGPNGSSPDDAPAHGPPHSPAAAQALRSASS